MTKIPAGRFHRWTLFLCSILILTGCDSGVTEEVNRERSKALISARAIQESGDDIYRDYAAMVREARVFEKRRRDGEDIKAEVKQWLFRSMPRMEQRAEAFERALTAAAPDSRPDSVQQQYAQAVRNLHATAMLIESHFTCILLEPGCLDGQHDRIADRLLWENAWGWGPTVDYGLIRAFWRDARRKNEVEIPLFDPRGSPHFWSDGPRAGSPKIDAATPWKR